MTITTTDYTVGGRTVVERVRLGAALLDLHGPDEWRSKVSADGLDLESATECVLGQLWRAETGGEAFGYAEMWDRIMRAAGFPSGREVRLADAGFTGFLSDASDGASVRPAADAENLADEWRSTLANDPLPVADAVRLVIPLHCADAEQRARDAHDAETALRASLLAARESLRAEQDAHRATRDLVALVARLGLSGEGAADLIRTVGLMTGHDFTGRGY